MFVQLNINHINSVLTDMMYSEDLSAVYSLLVCIDRLYMLPWTMSGRKHAVFPLRSEQ